MRMLFPVSPARLRALQRQMDRVGLREEDLEERFVQASGPGGQKVNKTSSCVVLRHRPTGLQLRCQSSRSQGLNRFLARRTLAERMAQRQGLSTPSQERAEKLRRQKQRRVRRGRKRLAKSVLQKGEV